MKRYLRNIYNCIQMIKDINDCAFLLVDNLTTMTEEGKIVNMKEYVILQKHN